MDMFAYLWIAGDNIKQFIRKIFRMRRGESDALNAVNVGYTITGVGKDAGVILLTLSSGS